MLVIDYHILQQYHNDSLLVNWSPTGISEDFANVAELKFQGLTKTVTGTQSCTCVT